MGKHGEWLELRTLREKCQLTKTELAKRTGFSLGYVNDLEVGRRRATPQMIAIMAKALDVQPVVLEPRVRRDERGAE